MTRKSPDSDSSGISPEFADLVAGNGGSASFVGRVRDAAEGSKIPDKFGSERIIEFLAVGLRASVTIATAVAALIRVLH
ncbi:hypothetical protein AB0368_06480 [Actinoplanes sp. NPDC051475]|uniref:hypothetical protein n=1 Tax=Actinoplanes sp. NPDC051475 TaxID=3157225 RepID=UPI00344C54CD